MKANILIDENRHACLADFGLLTFAADPTNSTASTFTPSIRGTTRWMSPELFADGQSTKESDRYALGMVILEVLSGQVPFVGESDYIVILKVAQGERPKRLEGAWFTNDIWGILERCWAHKPQDRPSLEDVLRSLEEISASWPTISHPIPSTANPSKKALPDQDWAPTTDVSYATLPSREVMSDVLVCTGTHHTRCQL